MGEPVFYQGFATLMGCIGVTLAITIVKFKRCYQWYEFKILKTSLISEVIA
jgi:hypothetical protein